MTETLRKSSTWKALVGWIAWVAAGAIFALYKLVEAWLLEHAVRVMITPLQAQLLVYGPSIVLFTLGFWLLWPQIRGKIMTHAGRSPPTATKSIAVPSNDQVATSREGGTGLQISGGSANSVLVVGFETGFDVRGGEVTDSVAFRELPLRAEFQSTSGEHAHLSNVELGSELVQLAARLRALHANSEAEADSASTAEYGAVMFRRNRIFESEFAHRARSLTGEAVRRIGDVSFPRESMLHYGGLAIRTGTLAGAFATEGVFNFLEHLAKQLPE